MEAGNASGAKKGALHEGRTLLYIDESGFYLLPALIKTYAPKGETPILRHKLTRDHLSVIGAIRENGKIYFGMQDKAYKSAAIIDFLEHLKRQVAGKMLLIWDGAPIHRSKEIKEYLATSEPGRIQLVPLPAYAPEVNPQEGIWRYLKYKELKNLACEDIYQLKTELLQAIKRLRHRHKVIRACFAQAEKCSQT